MATTLFLLACGVLIHTGFCRMVMMSHQTLLCIRVVIWLLTVSTIGGVGGVLVGDYQPGWPGACMAASMAAVQVATALLWRDGVPQPYRDQSSSI